MANSSRGRGPAGQEGTHSARQTFSDLIDSYQMSGRYVLTREQAIAALRVSDEAFKKAAQRLVAKRRLAAVRRGFFVIVPVEYREAGAPPPVWFVDELMRFHGQLYYVGLLSAAALHGATHQQPQEFQIVTGEQLRAAVVGRARLHFLRKRAIECTATMDLKTETGTLRVSTPEATALDLMRYLDASGHLGNVPTVLAELAEKIEGRRLAAAARAEGSLSTAQRLGYVLEQVGAGDVGGELANWIASLRPRFVPLRSDRPTRPGAKDARWRVLVNENIEAGR